MLSVRIWNYGREREDWREQIAPGDFLISQCFISTSVAFFAGDTKCFRAIKKKITMTTFANSVIYGKSILINPSASSMGHRRN